MIATLTFDKTFGHIEIASLKDLDDDLGHVVSLEWEFVIIVIFLCHHPIPPWHVWSHVLLLGS